MSDQSILTVILNYRTPELTLRACEAALRSIEDTNGEIVVVDNASEDGSFELLQKTAEQNGWCHNNRVRVLQSGRNGGFGAGMNFGMRANLSSGAKPDFYYVLNSDAWPEPNSTKLLRDFLHATPTAGLVGSYIQGEDNVPHQTAFRFPSITGEFEAAARTGLVSRVLKNSIITLPISKHEMRVDWTAGVSLMIRREVIEATDGFDENFFLYFEETDLCRRAAAMGFTTHYLPQSKVVHLGSASTGMKTWERTPPYWFDSRLRYFVKNHGVIYATISTFSLVLAGSLWRIRKFIQRKPQADPNWFLRDLVAHAIASIFRGPAYKVPPSPGSHCEGS